MRDSLESEIESCCELEFHVNPINAYNAVEIIEKDMRNGKNEYFAGIDFRIISYNTSLGTIGISCKRQDEARLKQILLEYVAKRFAKEEQE